jgi:hypothetical protein
MVLAIYAATIQLATERRQLFGVVANHAIQLM